MGVRLHIASIAEISGTSSARQCFHHISTLDSVGHHPYEPDPERVDAILFVDLHQHLDDPLARRLKEHPLTRTASDRVFVYYERDFPAYTFPGIYVSAPARWSSPLRVVGGPHPAVSPHAPNMSTMEPDLLFSFRGGATHRIRERLFALSRPRGVIERTSVNRFPPGKEIDSSTALHHHRFTQLIERSKFVLCPRGHGLSSFRLYEALAAGRVPVVISDEWLPPPRLNWESAIVRVRERDVADLPLQLEELEESWPTLAAGARSIAVALQPARLWDHYATSIEALMAQSRSPVTPSRLVWVYQRRAHLIARRWRNAIA